MSMSIHEFLPVIGLCGASGAGKTTLIEAMIPELLAHGLRVAVVKHGAHRVRVDHPGKDSDRFFRAGADVAVFGEERFQRVHDREGFREFLAGLAGDYDLVLVEGHASTPVAKIWLLGEGHAEPPPVEGEIIRILRPEERDPAGVAAWIMERLVRTQERVPLYGGILIGGRSRRMGRPKHLIEQNGRTWLERTVSRLTPLVDQVVLSGRGQVTKSCADLVRVPDATGLAGPLAGVLALLRWQPRASWLVVACDQPDIDRDAIHWLLEQRRPGVRGVLPDLRGDGRIEPLLAWYDFRCLPFLEKVAAGGGPRLSRLAGMTGVITPSPPPELAPAWRNVNTPEELAAPAPTGTIPR